MKRLSLVLLGLLALAPALTAGTPAPVSAMVAGIQGEAKHRPAKAAEFSRLKLGQRVGKGDTISTGAESSVRLKLPDGSSMLLNQNSELTLGSLIPKRGQRSTLKLLKGLMRWAIDRKKNPGMDYEVYIQTAVVAVKGTDFEVGYGLDGTVIAKTYSSTSIGVRLGPANGKKGLTVGAGLAGQLNKDGSFMQRPLSKEEYKAAAKQAGMPRPKAPKGAPDKPGSFNPAVPDVAAKGNAAGRQALDLFKASALGKDAQLGIRLAALVEGGQLGLEGLQRLLDQEEENALNLAKLKVLDEALDKAAASDSDPKALQVAKRRLALSLERDDLAGEALADDLGGDIARLLEKSVQRLALDPATRSTAEKELGGGAAVADYLLRSSRLPAEEVLFFARLDPLEAADLSPQQLGILGQSSDKLAEQLAGGGDRNAVILAQYEAITRAWEQLDPAVTGGQRLGDLWPTDEKAEAAGQTLRQALAEQMQELRQDLGDAGRLDQQQRANDLYSGSAFVDRRGYRVQVASTVLRPDAATVQKLTTSRRDEGPDKGTSVFSYKAVFNTALPEDWTGLLDRDLNDPANLQLGSPAYYKVLEQVSVLSPSGCAACITQSFAAPSFLSGAWRQAWAEAFSVMGLDRGQRSFDGFGVLQGGSDIITVTAAQQSDHWSFAYYNQTLGVEVFTARVWLLDRGVVQDPGLMGAGLLDLRSFGARFGGMVNELELSSPLYNGGSVDLLLSNPDFLQAF